MQGKGLSLRLGLLALVVVLIFGAVGSLSLARDAFDDADYDDCPAGTRLDAVTGLTVDRTDEDDEIRISWDALDAAALSMLGTNGYLARLTVIVEGGGDEDPMNLALGETSLVVDKLNFTKELTVSVAVTQGDYVISDIRETEFTSGMPAPSFKTTLQAAGSKPTNDNVGDPQVPAADVDLGNFYYLGFNDLFDNWYVKSGLELTSETTKPGSAKFRVGLVHGDGNVTPDDADFANYRITIEDSSGDLLGYQAETVAAGATYGSNKIVFGASDDLAKDDGKVAKTTNIRISNRVTDPALASYFASASLGKGKSPFTDLTSLSYGNVAEYDPAKKSEDGKAAPAYLDKATVYVDPPVEYFDFPRDVFDADGNYTLRAWAEDDDETRISPVASIVVNVQQAADEDKTSFSGYRVERKTKGTTTAATRDWKNNDKDTKLAVYQFSIQDE